MHSVHAGVQAAILVGAQGTRLRSIISDRPKTMEPFFDKPFLEYQIQLLRGYGIRNIALCTGRPQQQIHDHFGDGKRWGVNLRYSAADRPLGSAGALKRLQPYIGAPFVVLHSDTYCDLDLAEMRDCHLLGNARGGDYIGTVALTRAADAGRSPAVGIDGESRILCFAQKTPRGAGTHFSCAGVYLLEPMVLDFIPAVGSVSLENDTFPALLAQGQRMLGFPADGFFADIGRQEGCLAFERYVSIPAVEAALESQRYA